MAVFFRYLKLQMYIMNRLNLRCSTMVPKNIRATLKIYAFSLTIFSVFRFILLLTEWDRLGIDTPFTDILYSFVTGVRFDIVTSGYVLLLPFVLLSILAVAGDIKLLRQISFYFIYILFSISFLVCAADIPYFNQFFSRFSVSAFGWLDSPVFVLKMIFEEPRYWLFAIPFFIALLVFYRVLKAIYRNFSKDHSSVKLWYLIVCSVLFAGLMFIGIRGRLERKSPIRVGTAYFCNNPFLNQLGLNPNFTLLHSWLEALKDENKPVNLMNDAQAVANMQQYLNISSPDANYPLQRAANISAVTGKKHNVIIVMMESMSAAKMSRHGNPDRLTPFLDSLSTQGYYFENAYSAGIHTYNGIFGTLFSYPALFRQHSMKGSAMYKYHGIATTLKNNNYSTIYFTTHDGQFDNVEGFLKENDFERVVSKKDYPFGSAKTTLGVPDDFMFRFSIPILNDLSKKNKPFMAAMLTTSDHGPYYIPEYFKPRQKETKKQAVEYADYSLRQFMHLASQQSWFSNTIFVFVADHGAAMSAVYDLSLDYNHVPLLFYAPDIIKEKKTFSNMAGQIDIFPSIMGLLRIPYTNNTLGINLFEEKRPYIFFNADDKFGVIDSTWLLIEHKDKSAKLFRYRNSDPTDYSKQNAETVKRMRNYGESNLQTFQYILSKKKM